MKTSELLNRIEELGYKHKRESDVIKVYLDSLTSEYNIFYIKITPYSFLIEDGYCVHTKRSQKLVRYILDYLDTPLEEREEEEKKYRLKLPNGFESMLGEDYVCLTSDKVRERYVITAKETYHGFRNIFTQKEIDAMPFDTNFFIKEEVE